MSHHCYLAAPVQTSANVTLLVRGLIHPRDTDGRKGADEPHLPSCTRSTLQYHTRSRGAGEQHSN